MPDHDELNRAHVAAFAGELVLWGTAAWVGSELPPSPWRRLGRLPFSSRSSLFG